MADDRVVHDLCETIRARLPDELRYGAHTAHGRGPAFCCCDLLGAALLAAETAGRARLQEMARDRLHFLLSEISEDCYCAGWLIDNGKTCWRLAHQAVESKAPQGYGIGNVTVEQAQELLRLHEEAGGWWEWDDRKDSDGGGMRFYPTAEWVALVAEREASNG